MKKIKNIELNDAERELVEQVKEEHELRFGKEEDNKKKLKGYKGLRKIIPYYTKHKRACFTLLVLLVIMTVTSFFIPILNAEALAGISGSNFDIAIKFMLIAGIIRIVNLGFNYWYNVTYTKTSHKILFELRQTAARAIGRVKMSRVDQTNSGVFVDRINSDVGKCSDILLLLFDCVIEIISGVAFLIYIGFISIYMFLIMVFSLLIHYLIDSWRMKAWFKENKVIKKYYELSRGNYLELARGNKDIKSLNARENMLEYAGIQYGYAQKEQFKESKKNSQRKLFVGRFANIVLEIVLIVLGLLLVEKGGITLANFLVVYFYKGRVEGLTGWISQVKQYTTDGELAAQRVFEIVEDYEKETFGDIEREFKTGNVEFKNVTFSYEEDKTVLKNISFKIESNKTTAIVGKSGSGKSTILSLIDKLYDPQKGKILIDGLDINDYTENSLRSQVGVVSQMPYIFNTTIRRNMQFVKKDATDEEIWAALRQAQLEDFVRTQEKGLDSKIGENGVMLSGGQRQRLAIARVLLKGSKIIIFDEATSSLDNQSQSKIVEVLDSMKGTHTIIVVAHRLSTIVDADKIIMIDGGKMLQEGTHKEMLRNCKEYKELYLSEEEGN